MKALILAAALYTFGSITPTDSDKVFYCDSPSAARYHQDKGCKGLEKCTHTIREFSIEEAKQKGFTACKLEK
jgi:hypothetical protein